MSAALQYDPSSPTERNQAFAICELYQLLNEAMAQSAMVQGEAADDMVTALKKTVDLLSALNHSSAQLQTEMADKLKSLDVLKPWMTALGILSAVLGVGGMMAAGYGQALLGAVAAANGVAGASVGIVKGSCQLDVAELTGELAHQNGAITALSGNQQTYQATGKWINGVMGETFSRKGELAKTVTTGVKTMSEGLIQAHHDIMKGIYHNIKE